MNGGAGMFDNEQFTPPLGYPTSGSPQAGFVEAERSDKAAGSEPSGAGVSAHPTGPVAPPASEQHAIYYDPKNDPSLSQADDAKLRELVTNLRFSQPDEFSVYARMAQIEKQLADVLAVVEIQSEIILRLSKKAAA